MAAVDALWCGCDERGRRLDGQGVRHGPEQRPHREDLERLRPVEPRQHRHEPLGEHGLAGSGRPHEEEVVPAGRGELEGHAGLGLTDDVGEVLAAGAGASPGGSRAGSGTSGSRPPPARA